MSNKIRSIQKQREKHGIIIVKLEELIASRAALQSLLAQPLPARQAFEMSRTAKAIGAELESYEETRKALCERYSEGKMKEGEQEYDIPVDKLGEFNKEHLELVQAEVTINAKSISVSTLSTAQVSPATLMQLEWLIVE